MVVLVVFAIPMNSLGADKVDPKLVRAWYGIKNPLSPQTTPYWNQFTDAIAKAKSYLWSAYEYYRTGGGSIF